jgi:tellurite methyltransferase
MISSWLSDHAELLPRRGLNGAAPRALDVACGTGRHALWLGAAGFDVVALDRDAAAIARLQSEASARGLSIDAKVDDLECDGVSLGLDRFDLIVVFRYLHRPLFPVLRTAMRRNGLLVYETFTVDQAARGKPTNPAFLLEHGELAALVSPLEIIDAREGEFDGASLASVIARRRPSP